MSWPTKHGLFVKTNGKRTKEYIAWINMQDRCYNPNYENYRNYGGRGIVVCQSWRNSFSRFLTDVGLAPSKKHTLDRINNNGNYEPNNVRWATVAEQNRNKQKTIVYNGESATEASRKLGGCYGLVWSRINNGWPVERAFTEPRHR